MVDRIGPGSSLVGVFTLTPNFDLLKDRDEVKKRAAEELAADILNISCGEFVADAR